MAIHNNIVKLFQSQRLTDEEDGGGRAMGNEVIDDIVNNLFPDIARIDRTAGDVAGDFFRPVFRYFLLL